MSLIHEDYYSVYELAALKNVHPKSVYRWIRQGLAPTHELLGRMYWFDKKAAEAWEKPKRGRSRNP